MLLIVLCLSFFVFIITRTKLLMVFFQQDDYFNGRFLKFTFCKLKLVDKKFSAVLLLLAVLAYINYGFDAFQVSNNVFTPVEVFYALIFFASLYFSFLQVKYSRSTRKKLVVTARVKRILYVTWALYALLLSAAVYFHYPFSIVNSFAAVLCPVAFFIILTQLAPLMLITSNLILAPYEKFTQRKFLKEAKEKLARLNPTIVGITGSYGKTSTKHILSHITSSSVPIFFPAGGINTPMGITRVIREKLQPEHKFFVSEMGAYGLGSIERICNLTPPTHGIITAVGKMHFERFKSQDVIARTKFELADAVFKKGGKIVINAELVAEAYIDKYTEGHHKNVILVTRKRDDDFENALISDEKLTPEGIEFNLEYQGMVYKIECPIYGLHQVTNIAEAFVMSAILGVAPDTIVVSLKSMPQIQHRLEVFKNANTATVIDDVYNSNPIGFRSALGVLDVLKQPSGRRILVTPGMVELGNLHDAEHYAVGQYAAEKADILVAVIPKRIETLIEGFRSKSNMHVQKIVCLDTAAEVKVWVNENARPEDVILYENDLLDLYENKLVL